MTRTGQVPRLMAHQDEPMLVMHPADGARYGVTDGGLARVESRHGAAMLRVRLSVEQRLGEVFAPMHWTDRFVSTGPIDRVVGTARDPISGQPELKATAISISPIPVIWWGLLLRRSELNVSRNIYWSRVPVDKGHVYALAGWELLPDRDCLAYWVDGLLTPPSGAERVSYADAGRGVFRYASLVDGQLDACLSLAPGPVSLPGRETLAGSLGAIIEGAKRTTLLAGNVMDANSAATPGRIVCACFAVGLNMLQRAILERRAANLAEIGATLRAGTNCGSCIPELSAILRQAMPGMSAPG
jgi:assimilatory nitrate reductase catalytic subunit